MQRETVKHQTLVSLLKYQIAAPHFTRLFFLSCRYWLLDGLGGKPDWLASLPLTRALEQKTCSGVGRQISLEELDGGKGLRVSGEAGSTEKMGLVEVKKPNLLHPPEKF